MPNRGDTIPLLQTKLYRPIVTDDVVLREKLFRHLDAGAKQPLTLVSAPAGYGKSTLISHWLEGQEIYSAWISLDKEESDLRLFLQYFIAAIHNLFPDLCADLQQRLESYELPPVASLANSLSNDLAAVETSFVLILDDYHRLGASPVHEFISILLKHPPRRLRLILITRRNPPLALASLRAQGHMTEVRLRDLEFNQDETTALLEKAAGTSLQNTALAQVHKSTEGWPVGLRMAAQAMRYYEDMNEFLQSFGGNTRQVQDYLISEVMLHEEPAIRDLLCKISILDRFNAPLCAAICDTEADQTDVKASEDLFVAMLNRSGLLCIALDGNRQWFRYHHLFQALLHQQLVDRFSAEDIKQLHWQAAKWLEGEGFLEEAMHHLFKAGDIDSTKALILRNFRALYREEKWLRLDAMLSCLPAKIIDTDPELLMIKAWIAVALMRHTEVFLLAQQTEELLEGQPCSDELKPVFGQLDTILSWRSYATADGSAALAYAESAVERVPFDYDLERGYSVMMVSLCLQMMGRESEGIQLIYDTLERDRDAHPIYRARLFEALGYALWMAGDLIGLRDAGAAMIRLGEKEMLPVTGYNGHYQMAKALYSQGELEQVKKNLSEIINPDSPPYNRYLIQATYFLALTHEALGESDHASRLLDNMTAYLLDTSNAFSLSMVRAFQAELALRQGRLSDAEKWLASFEPSSFPQGEGASNNELTAAKVLLHQRTPASLKKAAKLLAEIKSYFEKIHNTRFLIETLALQALVFQVQEKISRAEACLEEAVNMAMPGGFIRLFVDLGPDMSKLLNRLNLNEETLRYVGKIQGAFRGAATEVDPSDTLALETVTFAPAAIGLLDPLTKRENEILALLTERRSNQEMADTLNVSVKTICRHTENLYSKLGVHSRHGAVAKAEGLGIIK